MADLDAQVSPFADVEDAYRRLSSDLVRFATVLVGPDAAADVVSSAVVRLLDAGDGSVRNHRAYLFQVVQRSNDLLRANGIEQLHHSWKTHSSSCSISHMVLYLPFEELGSAECRFWEAFADDLAEGTTQEINEPESCSS